MEKLIFENDKKNLIFEDQSQKLLFENDKKKMIFDITQEIPVVATGFPYTLPYILS